MSDNSSSKPVAVVTGASAGIGAVYARRLAARGFDLMLVARRADRLATLSKEVQKEHGTKVAIVAADLTDSADLGRVEQHLAAEERITMLVNNAGSAKLAPMSATSTDEAASMIALNITALTRLTQAVLPNFLKRNSGSIINVASVLSLHSLPISSVYSGTKGYVLNFSRGLQAELTDTGIRVQLVLPATTSTELWDIAGVPLSQLNQSSIMTAENMVDASLAGYDRGEAVTLPSVDDTRLWEAYDAARGGLVAASQTGQPASRYGVN
ncbi:AraC family transcriptional regulator [Bradyrhizobium sp. CCBAU 11386]|uniref:SDR family NAD(P)-dependent oxidoreductase n=1 Tax=Bradyrhizobium sp. CCBAU 11386 TaxID=1630837 RepID=UPI0023029D1F|nr:SDR family oxidoreductase [Bradyrhizobium sp. CCBAU 11386]MDA9509878.1 AraC family transcriptional regulator [Bradyrhizobium sp. CCBAU 11386]